MYKKASRLKVRFASNVGNLTVEQLWGIKMSDLKEMIKAAHEVVKKIEKTDEDLLFLEGIGQDDKEETMAKLRFDILKDVYITRMNETKAASEEAITNKEIKHLEEILAKKREESLSSMSEEEIMKLIEEKKKKLGKLLLDIKNFSETIII